MLHRSSIARLLTLIVLAVGGADASAQEPLYFAEEIKAAFLYHFGTYVQWPEPAQASDDVTIAVLGADEVAAELADFLPGRLIQGRPARVRRLDSLDALEGDEIVFIGARENERLAEHLAQLAGRPTLVVTDVDAGLTPGAMINFRLVDDRVRFEISVAAAEGAGLMLSSRLLSAALRVETAQASRPRARRAIGSGVFTGDGSICTGFAADGRFVARDVGTLRSGITRAGEHGGIARAGERRGIERAGER